MDTSRKKENKQLGQGTIRRNVVEVLQQIVLKKGEKLKFQHYNGSELEEK